MKNLLLFSLLCCLQHLSAQSTAPDRLLDFKVDANSDVYTFSPITPPLMQKPGAPKAYWSYFWEFGDGSFSREENPSHIYTSEGDFVASLDATAHYDDGKKAKKKNKPLHANGGTRLSSTKPTDADVFDRGARQMVAMLSYSKPRAEEEITLVLSYRNLGLVPTDGRLHLFFNEKKFPAGHFEFVEARTHFGEMVDMSTSQVLPLDNTPMMDWVTLPLHASGGVSTNLTGDVPTSVIIQELLNNARGVYREENAWRFTALQPGEKRNLFVSLACTANMLKDTNAIIHLEAVFAPFDPAVAPEKFVYEIEIVGSHDPNAIAVSDNRVNYRTLGRKKLDYKIQFQNNGEGPASTVALTVEIPNGLKMGAMRPVEWYPKCPICPKTPGTQGCLDTTSSKDGLVFTFRNIYLPGTRQKDVDSRDSTKGFVKYRIEADRNMPKHPFRSRAKIVFDKNPPIYTNYTKTGFKVGVSPGLKVGYSVDPEDSLRNGYVFLGASLSPYKSWRMYPQVELLTGLKGRTDLPAVEKITVVGTQPNNGLALLDTVLTDTVRRASRGFVSFEVPVLIRKNFSRFFGMGLGASARVILENGETRTETSRSLIDWKFMDTSTGFMLIRTLTQDAAKASTENYHDMFFQYTLFGDLSLGSVRAGPNLGLRGGVILGEKDHVQPFVQLSLELKL